MEPGDKKKEKRWVPTIVKDGVGEHGANGEDEPELPDWVFLSDILKRQDPLFRNMLFLEGYDLSSNIYVIVGEYLTVVDPGNDYSAFLQLFGHPEYAPEDIRKIVLTHGHPGHAMATMELFRYPSIKNNPQLEIIIHGEGPLELKRIIQQFGVRIAEVKGGEILDLCGFPWKVIHTPGHTVDAICLHHASTRTLISGDLELPYGVAASEQRAGGQVGEYLNSLKSLLEHDIENILPGHGAPVSSTRNKVVEESYFSALSAIIGSGRKQPSSFFEAASAAVDAGLLEDALFCCDMALAGDADNSGALKLKAFCLNDMGRFDEAIQTFTLLEGRFPSEKEDLFTTMGRGNALLGVGRYEEGLLCFEKVLKSRPDRTDAQRYKGFALYLSGRVSEAMEIEAFRNGFTERLKEELLRTVRTGKAEKQ